ncbi:MAG: beta-galactosidase [Odoribacter sp.]|nr:beta-galactosidase [Odoribacter sp.]
MKHWLIIFLFFFCQTLLAQQTEKMMLSGEGFGDRVEWDFFCTKGRNSGEWNKIAVPSQWELEGFGEYTYGRWYTKKGERPSDEEGIYRRSFSVPKEWKGKKVRIVFEGVMTDTEVKINGKLAGDIHQGGFYRFSYDISDKVIYGAENNIEVKVSKESANRLVNAAERKADWWLFGGIYRPVYLEILPASSIEHIAVNAKHDGRFAADVILNGAKAGYQLVAKISHLNESSNFSENKITLTKNDLKQTRFECKWEGVKSWNPEDPNLYVLEMELQDNKGNVLHHWNNRIGFRTVEFRPKNGIYVNDTKILMKGINRHSFWPDGGRTTNREISLNDALLIKEMNMNAVRFHYPPDVHFLEMCDSLGLFVIDELAGWQNAYDTETGSRLVRQMIMRDVNHPSIIIWSNGNEGGWNTKIDEQFAWYDPQNRHVIHPWADFDGLDTHHYPAYQTGVARFTNGYNIFMPTEFMHGAYDQGHGAGLEDFWNKYKEHPLFAGGFMWDFSDNAVKRTDKNGILDSDGELGADGILGPYREKEASYYTVREVWSPIQFKPLYITPSFKGEFFITNEYLYTNLNECSMQYRLIKVGSPFNQAIETEIGNGNLIVPALEPGETGKLRFSSLPDNFFEADILEVTAYDKYSKSICTWTWSIHYASEYAEKHIPYSISSIGTQVKEENGKLLLSANGVTAKFDLSNGILDGVENSKGKVSFGNGPVPVGMQAKFKEAKYRNEGGDGIFTVYYLGGIDSIRWTMTPGGLLKMDAVMLNRASGGGGFDDAFLDENIMNFGISFDYPETNVKGMKWFGRGPYRVWKNRIKGTNYGIWDKEYNNTMTGASFESLIYPEFKGYHANLYWATLETKETDFTVMSESDGLFFRVYTPEEPQASKDRALPPFPSGDISFLYDIPAMRCFKPLSQHGPASQPGSIRIKKGDEGIRMILWFDFNAK